MIFFPVVNEACRLLAEGIAVKASDLDIAAVMGMGFPAYRGGIIFWANSLGSKYICSKLEKWSKIYGEFFKPCAYLVERASKGDLSGEKSKLILFCITNKMLVKFFKLHLWKIWTASK
ncbi:hypothetical protein L1049_004824 [Liquidambar formosana]|uniref:3-hydroxyacyl-CoA dehydrogenase C-terminal domain-containing protein n=1 Tax=Liquidambar formosana TaxID=63359 RepID=A0AAP0RP50_LIQFO